MCYWKDLEREVKPKADDRLSRTLSELLRQSRGQAQGYEEMAHYGILDDFLHDRKHVESSLRAPYEIVERNGYTWKTLLEEVADRIGLEVEFTESDWTGEETARIKHLPYSVYRSEWWQAIPTSSFEDARVGEMLSHTP